MKNRRALLFAASIICWAGIVAPASAQEFAQVTGTLAQVAAGRAEVWGLDASQKVYRYNPAGKKFDCVTWKPMQFGLRLGSQPGGG